MRALICDDYQGIDGLRVGDFPDPEPAPGMLLVEVGATAVDFADTLIVAGRYQVRPEPPFVPGHELAGTVIDGGGSGFQPGDRVCGFTPFGGMAEKATIPAENAARLSDGVSFSVGAVLPATYGTSYHALVDRAGLQAGESLLVLGAAGGVGLAAVQIGRLIGARVVAAVSSEEKADLVMREGADEVIRYDMEDLREGIARTVGKEGVDVVYDPVGGDMTEQALRSTRWNGRLLVVGFAAGGIPSIPLNLTLLKGNSIVGVFWGRFTTEEPEKARANLDRLIALVESGTLSPVIAGEFSLEEGQSAMRWVAERKALGRAVLTP